MRKGIILFRIVTLMLTVAFLNSYAFSQNTKLADITAEGSSRVKVIPDIVSFTLAIDKTDTIEKMAIRNLNEEVQRLSATLEKLGFPNKSIKVSDYRITSTSGEESNMKRYSASNVLKVEFKLDNKLIDALYAEIEANEFKDLDITYETGISLSLEKATRLTLVQAALGDAQANANNIAKSMGLTIAKVKMVYKESPYIQVLANQIVTVNYNPPKIVGATHLSFKTSFDKFQVEETELTEKITVVYEVSN